MSYRCDICGIKVPPRVPRLVHQVIRQRQIVRELAVCEGCRDLLRTTPLESIKDPYYLRLRKFREVDIICVPVELPDRAPLPIEQLGRKAKNVTLFTPKQRSK